MLGPILLGECYPFSIAPMFCEQPTCYCEYAITGPNGEALSLEAFGLQRIYDGNPVGLGVGIVPPETLDRFGEVPTPDQVISHVQSRRDAWGSLPYVDVSVEVIGDLEGVRVGRVDERSFVVRVPAPGDRP